MIELLNNIMFVFLLMIFLHIIADFLVQNNFLATYKQKKNWEPYVKEHAGYKYDYIIVLCVHSFSWSFITFSPLLFICDTKSFGFTVIINTIIHGIIDDFKCNRLWTNLIADQLLHLLQIVITLIVVIYL